MRTFSDDIVTPEKQMEAIKVAFEAQNMFFVQQIKAQTKPIMIAVGVLVGLNVVTLSAFLYTLFV